MKILSVFSLNPPKKDGLTVRNVGKTNSLVVFSLLFFHYSLFCNFTNSRILIVVTSYRNLVGLGSARNRWTFACQLYKTTTILPDIFITA